MPVISEPAGGAPPPFIVPIFNLPDGDDDDHDHGSNGHQRDTSEGGPSVQITFSASPKAQPKPLPPTVSTASEASTMKRRGGGVVCEGCGEVILGKLIGGSNGRVWHPKCYKCTTCGLQLEHVSPYEHDGKLYCHFDYHEVRPLHTRLFPLGSLRMSPD